MKTKGLAFRYSLLSLLGVFIVFLFAFIYIILYSGRLFREEGRKDAANTSAMVIARIENSLQQIESPPSVLKTLLEEDRKNLGIVMKTLGDRILENGNAFASCVAFEPYMYNRDSLYFAPYILERNGKLAYLSLAGSKYDYFSKEWYRKPKELGRPYWSEPYYDEGGGDTLMCTYSVPFYLKNHEGKRVFGGVITMDISLTALSKVISDLKVYETGFGFLVSKNGKLIAGRDAKNHNMDVHTLVTVVGRNDLEPVIDDMLNGGSGFLRVEHFGSDEPSWLYYAPLPSTGWCFGLVFPRSELFSAVFSLFRGLVLIFGISIALIVIITLMVTRKFTRPIAQLLKATQRIGQGDFSTPLPVYRSKDEIAQLSNSFLLMKEELITYIRNLRDATAEKEKIESELHVAQTIQMGMLPTRFPDRPGIDLYASLVPARMVGGDLYDFFFPDENHLFFAIGDVSGKGIPASLFMTLTRTLVRSGFLGGIAPEKALKRVNSDLVKENPNFIFVTFLTGILDLETGEVVLCNAGHNPPLILTAGGEVRDVAMHPNLPLGIDEEATYITDSLRMEPGDRLVLYTDGIPDAENEKGEFFTEKRLKQAVAGSSAATSIDLTREIITHVREFVGGAEQSDDITLLVIGYRSRTAERPARSPKTTLTLKNSMTELSSIEESLERIAGDSGWPSAFTGRLNLILEEIFTNIVYYGYDDAAEHPILITIESHEDKVRVVIRDDGKPFDILGQDRPETGQNAESRDVGGLGIHLVKSLAGSIEYRRNGRFNEVTFTQPIPKTS